MAISCLLKNVGYSGGRPVEGSRGILWGRWRRQADLLFGWRLADAAGHRLDGFLPLDSAGSLSLEIQTFLFLFVLASGHVRSCS
jgi:hypothetical protein